MCEKMIEVTCGGCGAPLFYGEVLRAFAVCCGKCSFPMMVEVPKPVPALAEAIVESFRDNPEVCNCADCRSRRPMTCGCGLFKTYQSPVTGNLVCPACGA